eukprot:CAMPEP_0117442938 /NCGR_PEP_ID=MMETSP0759-20121206/4421_1 /TAXON_ID=63605 /ORGANISM="Percolomonas cosmopolitus, Strain WS" /LENGTH=673 /DNA_ID=CAMNT_0005234865 /DNA_START=162 /DNA_END=2183 /DNA_ORIENTATION=+
MLKKTLLIAIFLIIAVVCSLQFYFFLSSGSENDDAPNVLFGQLPEVTFRDREASQYSSSGDDEGAGVNNGGSATIRPEIQLPSAKPDNTNTAPAQSSHDTKKSPSQPSLPPPPVSIALTVYNFESNALKRLVHFLKHAAQQWPQIPIFMLTNRPNYLGKLLKENHIAMAHGIKVVPQHANVDTSLGVSMAKGEALAHLLKTADNVSLQTRYVLYMDHTTVPFYKVQSMSVFLAEIAKECGKERDVVLWRNTKPSKSGAPKAQLSSKWLLLDRENAALDFLRLWHNFMDMMAFHKETNDEVPLDFTFVAEGYPESLEHSSSSEKKDALTFCSIENAPHLIAMWEEELDDIKEVEYDQAAEQQKPEFDGLTDLEGRPVDYLIAIKVVSCTARQTVEHLNKLTKPQRIIYMAVFADTCRTLLSYGDNVRCIWENHVIPGFSKKVIQDHSSQGEIKRRAGWYLLQIMNLYASNLVGLSEHYIVWDADGVPVISMNLFDKSDKKVVFYAGDEHDKWTSIGYHRSYTQLTGNPAIDPPDEKESAEYVPLGRPTWVAHFMVFKKEFVQELLAAIEEHTGCEKDKWMFEVVKVINAHEERALQRVGFGEYDAYGSFVKLKHPEYFKIDLDSHKTCARLRHAPSGYKGDCCIPESEIEKQTKAGAHYIVREYEVGNCDKTDA